MHLCLWSSNLFYFYLETAKGEEQYLKIGGLFKSKKRNQQKNSSTKLMLPVQKLLKMYLLSIQCFIYGKTLNHAFIFLSSE